MVEGAGAWCSHDCADFLPGLAFTGCRKGEAAEMRWRDLDFAAGEIVVRGHPRPARKIATPAKSVDNENVGNSYEIINLLKGGNYW